MNKTTVYEYFLYAAYTYF